jgi:hypothetical protein
MRLITLQAEMFISIPCASPISASFRAARMVAANKMARFRGSSMNADTEAAAEVLRMQMLDLKHRPDGAGGVIVSGDRYARYFEADGQL